MLPDVQLLKPEVPIGLSRVGATGIKKLVQVERKEKRPIILISTFDIFVDLPSDRKGVNLSRNFEVIDEVIESLISKPVRNVEDLNLKIVENLLDRHEYATKAEVVMTSELIMRKKTPKTGQKTQEVVKILCEARMWRNGKKLVFIGVEVSGITACPCAQELVRAKAIEELVTSGYKRSDAERIVGILPMATHNQRGKASVKIQITDDFTASIDQLIEIAKSSMSYDIYEILKREDELEVVYQAHKNPRFVEDSVRIMAKVTVEKFKNAPDNILVIFRQENEESIHQHNVIAERVATMGELRHEIGN